MAVALITDGSQGLHLDSKITIPLGEDFTLRFVLDFTSEVRGHQIGERGAFDHTIALRFTNNSNAYVEFDGVGTVLNYASPLVIGVTYDVEVQRRTGVVDIVDTATQTSLLSATKINNNEFAFDEFFVWGNNGNPFTGKTQLIQLTSTTSNNKWDATASDHGAVTVELSDTISGNDATDDDGDFPTDGSAWVDLGGSGTEQPITLATTEQPTQSETVSVMGIGFANAIVSESITQSQLVNVNETSQLNAIVSEQKTESNLIDVSEVNQASSIVIEQLTHSYLVDVASNGAQALNVIITEQKTQSELISIDEIASVNAITSEQLTQSNLVNIDESSGAFVSVVQTEQITQSELISIHAIANISAIVCEQNTQATTQHISVDITLDTVICEQLTHAELITIVQSNIANALNLDIDKITIEILTPTHEIEMLTPTYTIEHL